MGNTKPFIVDWRQEWPSKSVVVGWCEWTTEEIEREKHRPLKGTDAGSIPGDPAICGEPGEPGV